MFANAIVLVLLTSGASAEESRSSAYHEAAVFGDESADAATAADRDREPGRFLTPPSAAPLKLAPAKRTDRVVPASASKIDAIKPARDSSEKLTLSSSKRSQSTKGAATAGMPSASTMIGSLAIVVGLFLLLAWVLRRGMPKQTPLLPQGMLEVLGRAPLVGRQQVHLVRLGNKLLLIAITPGGIETLTEVTDPMEIDRLAGICQQSNPYSSSKSFNQLLGNFSNSKTSKRGSFSKEEPDFSSLEPARSGPVGRERRHA
jgi:flagellar biogenesis protein FliO